MGYIGQTPTAVPLDGDDLSDDIITLAKMASGTDGNIITYDASGNPAAVATGTDGQVLTSTGAGSAPAFEALPASGYTELGVAATTSGSSSTISSIPAAVKTVLIILNKVSCTGAAEVNLRLGDSGGLESSGYLSNTFKLSTSSQAQYIDTAHFGLSNGGGGGDLFSTVMNVTRSASGVHDWVVTWIAYGSNEPAQTVGVGMKTLSGELTQIGLVSTGTFDAGNWNAYYQ